MSKRFATSQEIDAAPRLEIMLPQSAHPSDPFSSGSKPELYSEADLKKVAVTKHARTDEFEKRLIAIWWATGERPVPFVFRTNDGSLRSLDAGCVGFLLNRWKPDCTVVLGNDGMVVAVAPNASMVERYAPIKSRLVAVVAQR